VDQRPNSERLPPGETMNVKRLKQLIANLPDEMPVLVTIPDHSYRECTGAVTTALRDKHVWSEDHGEENTPESEYGKRTRVLVMV